MKTILIFGATSSIAEHCARLWIKKDFALLLVGRDQIKLDAIARDLEVRAHPDATGTPRIVTRSMEAGAEADYAALVQWAKTAFGQLDGVLIAHGVLSDQRSCESDLALARQSIEVNGVSAALLAEAFAAHFTEQKRGFIAVIGSVAGDRGRQSNYIYGASKGFVERYLQGLRNRLYASKVQVILIKPGPTDTPMTSEFKARGARLADPADVAKAIVDGIEKGAYVIYAPGIWRWIMLVVRSIPERIFVRLKL